MKKLKRRRVGGSATAPGKAGRNSVVNLGKSNQLGDTSFGDVARRDVNKPTFNIFGSSDASKKQLEAFQEVAEFIGIVNRSLNTFASHIGVSTFDNGREFDSIDGVSIGKIHSVYVDLMRGYQKVYATHRIFLPPDVDRLCKQLEQELQETYSQLYEDSGPFGGMEDIVWGSSLRGLHNTVTRLADEIVSAMRQFLKG